MAKPKLATTSLAGCFGCHMSILDIDERILELVELVDFDKSPVDDIKTFSGRCAVGLVEGGCCNEENVKVLRDFREHCDVLISVGDCAINGGIPAMRNTIPLRECLEEAYLNGPSVHNPAGKIPDDPEIPLLLNRVFPCHEVVKIDYHLPGCPPPADTLWQALVALLTDKPLALPYALIKYD
ncbi:MAG: NADP oxidoreductase [Candidatus Krumholzibacteriia bacterium]|nr:NADP oxidoreductase [bacterium]MCB9514461.1 NADP oxidoreductase [Candidatus Latescibacterota bacterium]MCB9517265.1 NADP oxidoreductase [Candidatus Latescibacterota bacterium]